MDEKRLTEIEQDVDLEAEGIEPGYWSDTVLELIAEVRRLQRELLSCRARNHEVYVGT